MQAKRSASRVFPAIPLKLTAVAVIIPCTTALAMPRVVVVILLHAILHALEEGSIACHGANVRPNRRAPGPPDGKTRPVTAAVGRPRLLRIDPSDPMATIILVSWYYGRFAKLNQ
jgi:hypothetical protein